MFGLESLDVIIGIITIYLIFALACTAIVEAWSSLLDQRGKNLKLALTELLHGHLDANGTEFVDAFFAHPQVQSLSLGDKGLPSYISPQLVSRVVESILTNNGTVVLADAIKKLPDTIQKNDDNSSPNRVKAILSALLAEAKKSTDRSNKLVMQHYVDGGIAALKQAIDSQPETIQQKVASGNESYVPNPTKEILKSLLKDAENEAASFRILVEEHFDAVMDRASGWYKRHAQYTALTISAFLVIGANVDTLKLASTLSTNPQARQQIVELAQKTLNEAKNAAATSSTPATHTLQEAGVTLAKTSANLNSTGIQLGWKDFNSRFNNSNFEQKLSKFIGLLISILAISLGAPFWFDMLNRVMQIRSAGVSPREKAATSGSKS